MGWRLPLGHSVYKAKLKASQVHITSPPVDVTVFSVAKLEHGKWDLPLHMAGKLQLRMCCFQIENFQSRLTTCAVISVDATR